MFESLKIKLQCAVCDTKIWDYNGAKVKKTAQYNEADVLMSDSTVMTVGVCKQHKNIQVPDLKEVNRKIKDGWLEEVALGIGHSDWVQERGLSLEAVGVK